MVSKTYTVTGKADYYKIQGHNCMFGAVKGLNEETLNKDLLYYLYSIHL